MKAHRHHTIMCCTRYGDACRIRILQYPPWAQQLESASGQVPYKCVWASFSSSTHFSADLRRLGKCLAFFGLLSCVMKRRQLKDEWLLLFTCFWLLTARLCAELDGVSRASASRRPSGSHFHAVSRRLQQAAPGPSRSSTHTFTIRLVTFGSGTIKFVSVALVRFVILAISGDSAHDSQRWNASEAFEQLERWCSTFTVALSVNFGSGRPASLA